MTPEQLQALNAAAERRQATPSPAAAPKLIGTVGNDWKIYQMQDGQLAAQSPGASTNDQDTIRRLMAGETFTNILQDENDRRSIARHPVAARANEVLRGVPFVGSYADEAVGLVSPTAQAGMRNMTEAMQRQHPGQTLALNAAGAVAGTVPVAMSAGPAIAARAATTVAGRALQGMTVGAVAGGVEGAVYGAGEGATPTERVTGATEGAVWGAGAGAGLGLAAPYAADAALAATNWTRDAVLRRMIGLQGSDEQAVMTALGVGRPAARLIKRALDVGDPYAASVALGRAGDEAMLADAGIAGAELLDAAAQSGGQAAQVVRNAMRARTRAATAQIGAALDDALGSPMSEREMVREIRTGTAPAREKAYTAAYAVPIDYSNRSGRALEGLLKRVPARAWREADALMQTQGEGSLQRLVSIDGDTVTIQQLPDVRQLDYITRALGDMAESQRGKGGLGGFTAIGRANANLARDIRGIVRRAVPEYDNALQVAGAAIAKKQMIENGYNLFRSSTRREDVVEMLTRASAEDKAAARAGLRSYIDDQMANVARTIMDPDTTTRSGLWALRAMSTDANKVKLRVLLGKGTADKLLDRLESASVAFELRAAIAQNSKTAVRQSIRSTVDAYTAGGPLRTLMGGEPVNATKRLTTTLTGETPEAKDLRAMGVYNDIAQALTGIRGARSRTALAYINNAMKNEALVTEGQSKIIAAALLSLDAGAVRTAEGFQLP